MLRLVRTCALGRASSTPRLLSEQRTSLEYWIARFKSDDASGAINAYAASFTAWAKSQ
jgi:hypothetical protein